MKSNSYIAVEGNIGSGKTTLAKLLAEELNAKLILEKYEENPFLKGFYREPERYAFSVEMSFLADRYHQLSSLLDQQDLFQPHWVADYAPFKSLVFSQNNLSGAEFELYRKFWHMSLGNLRQVDLLIYLVRPVGSLQKNIQKRGRIYEQDIDNEYLTGIHKRYESFLKQLPKEKVLRLNADEYDFLESESDVKDLSKLIINKLALL
mgnify:CR=1 FL=1